MKKYLPDLIAVVAFVALSLVYFFPADIEGRILFQQDTSAGMGAGHEAAEYYEQTGERTRWTDALFGGMPTYQISPSYDSTQPLAWAQKVYQLFLPDYVCLTFIMMLGFYILLRAFGLSAWLSGLGGILWAFSSYFFILISAGHIWKFVTLAYMPPTLAGVVMAYRGKTLKGALVFALFTALQILSNHVQMTYYFLFVILFFVLAYLAEAVRRKAVPQFLKTSAVLLVAGLVGLSANISNLYHTYSYSKETMRGKSELVDAGASRSQQQTDGLDRDYITQWSYGIGETMTLLVPNFKGGASVPLSQSSTAMAKANPQYTSLYGSLTQYFGDQPMTSGPVYVGAFVLFLFFAGCFIVRGPMKWALVGGTVFSVMLSWGKNFMPVTDFFIDFVPMYDKFRAVSSILVIAEFTIPLLAVLALKEIISRPDVFARDKKAFLVSLALTLGMALLIYVAPAVFTGFVSQQETQMLQSAAAQGMIPTSEVAGIMQNLEEMRRALVTSDALRSVFVIAAGIIIVLLYIKGKLRANLAVCAIAVLCLADMWAVNKRYLNDAQFVQPSVRTTTFRQTDADRQILQDTDLNYRVLNFATNTFNENNTSYWHKSIGGYHAAKLRRYQELIEHHISREMQDAYSEVLDAGGDMDSVSASKFRVINMLNARYLIFPTQDGTVPIRNPYALGNAWFVDSVRYVGDANEEISALDDIMPENTAVVDARFKSLLNGAELLQKDAGSSIVLTAYEPNRVTYRSDNAHDGVAVFSEIYYPHGWQVSIDGSPVGLARADYVLRTLYVPAGTHTIEMVFDPQSLHVTETIAYIAIALMLVGVGAVIIIERRKLTKSGGQQA